MKKIMMQCPNCGAEFDAGLAKCPYCGCLNPEGAEKEYLEKLEGTRRQLDSVDERAAETVKAEVRAGSRRVLKRILITAVIVLALLGLHLLSERNDNETYRLTEEEIAWQREAFPQLDALIEAGDYEGAVRKMWEFGAQDHRTWDYAGSVFLEWYEKSMTVRDVVRDLDEKGTCSKEGAALLTYDAFGFYYRDYAPEDRRTALSDKEIRILDSCREEVLPVLHGRMGFTDAQMEEFKTAVYDKYGILIFNECEKIAKKYGGQYR